MAEKFVPRQRKHKVLARQTKASHNAGPGERVAATPVDSNALEILPEAKRELEDAKAQLRADLRKQGVKVSSKKAQRLAKYVETKLKKDQNRVLLAKLAATKIDTSLFAKTSSLGQGKETRRQMLQRALKEHAAGIGDDSELFEERVDPGSESEPCPGRGRDQATPQAAPEEAPQAAPEEAPESAGVGHAQEPSAIRPVALGSGLKRPLELGDDGRPVMQKRQKRGGVKSKITAARAESQLHLDAGSGDEWNGFSSANDSGKDEAGSEASESGPDGNESGAEEAVDAESDDVSGPDEGISDGEDDGESDEGRVGIKERSSAFKAWAHQQRNEALGYQPVKSGPAVLDIPRVKDFKPRPLEEDPLPPELQPVANSDRQVFSVAISRPLEIQEARLKLPIVAEEQRIMEAIHNNNIVVICGATGSGKTTQVPQFLYEAGYGVPNSPTPGLIGVTQPRKVAAVSMSKRVGQELGDHSHTVAYQIRFEGTADDQTAVKFMTDGVLLRELSTDIALRKYSAVIIDEAHERSVNTDILIGMLSRVVKLRQEMAEEDRRVKALKLVIMSATLKIDDLTRNPVLFPTPPPVLDIEGRQFPVTVHFARQTRHDYVDEMFKKITKGHRRLPPGAFLVFLTGYDEISRLSEKLKLESGGLNAAVYPKVRISANDAPLETEDIDFGESDNRQPDGGEDEEHQDDEQEDEADFDVPGGSGAGPAPLRMHVLPLYSLLPTREQMRVFEPAPDGTRQIILATNIAETSLTIPGVRYVFDCGRSKERRYDKRSGVQSYEIGWISKASANQRSGRAGRTGPGHCYRLYSSAVYERDFQDFAEPELLRMPIEGVVLQLKAMRLQHVVNFPFPTPPDRHSLAKAERLLKYISAITPSGQATEVGSTMARFPLPPRFARILLIGHLHDCLPYTIALVAGLSVAEMFLPESQAIPKLVEDEHTIRTNDHLVAETRQKQARQRFNQVHRNFCSLDDASDAIKLLQVVGEFAHDPTEDWCEQHFVRFKALQESQKLRRQLTNLLQKDIPAFANLAFRDRLERPTAKQITALKQMVAAGFIDQVALRADLAPVPAETMNRKPRRAIDVPYLPLQHIDTTTRASRDAEDDGGGRGLVYIHPTSPLAHRSVQECPQYIIYSGLQRAAAAASAQEAQQRPKTRMLALTDVTGAQLAALAKGTPLISYGKPVKEVPTADPSVRQCFVVPYLRAEGTGGLGWPLPVRKVTQRRVPGRGWVVE